MHRLKVLVTDDEREMRRAVERALTPYTLRLPDVEQEIGFEVVQATSGEEALEKIAADVPDILLLDHKMGGMSGLDVLDELAGQDRDMITVMITAYASLETAVIATKRGAFDFIAKPFTPLELKETVRKATSHLISQREARRLTQEKRQVRFQFISVLAHELKAPLGAIEGYLSILSDRSMRQDPEKVDQMVQRSLIRCEGMRKLIYDLLDLTRIESGLKKRDLVQADVVEVAQAAIETHRAAAADRGITIELHGDGGANMTADRSELEIILNNLISNAIKYNRERGRVDVTVTTEDEQVLIRVSDTGIGMTPEECARLFQDFVRIKNNKTKNILGSGLGLSTVRKLANLYGGDATAASRPDEGSTFTVRLNRRTAGQADAHGSAGNIGVAAAG